MDNIPVVKKLWSFYITVKVLEYEFSTPKLIYASTFREARKIARDYTKDYYGDGEETFDKNTFSFNGGCPLVEFTDPVEMQMENWSKMALDRALITKKPFVAAV